MTPAQQYAERRSHAVALIEAHAPRSQQPLIDLLRPAIALNITRRDDAATTPRRRCDANWRQQIRRRARRGC